MSSSEGHSEAPALFIGRFQPFHKGHLFMIKHILKEFDHLIIGIGSAQYSHSEKNPFTSKEREEMITRSLSEEGINAYEIVKINDTHDHNVWAAQVEAVVPHFGVVFSNDPLTIRLLRERGHDVRELPLHEREKYSGTEVRRRILSGEEWRALVPRSVFEYLQEIDGVGRVRTACSSERGHHDHEKK